LNNFEICSEETDTIPLHGLHLRILTLSAGFLRIFIARAHFKWQYRETGTNAVSYLVVQMTNAHCGWLIL